MRTLIIDNYDSFTHNLVHLVSVVNKDVPIVVRNDELDWRALEELNFDNAIISPGPGHPAREADFGICARFLKETSKPTLGVCLGHQGIATVMGGLVERAPQPVHGKAASVRHNGIGILKGVPSPFLAARYHSLIVKRPLPSELLEFAWTADDLVMGLMHRTRPLWGLQFHPESIISEHGDRILRNFRDMTTELSPRPVSGYSKIPDGGGHTKSRVRLVWREIPAPPSVASAYAQLFAKNLCSFWLDSSLAERGRSRWSYFGAASDGGTSLDTYDSGSKKTVHYRGSIRHEGGKSILDYLSPQLRCDIENPPPCPFVGGWVGYLGYELGREFGGATRGQSSLPDVVLQLVDRFIAFDHEEERMYAICVEDVPESGSAQQWLSSIEVALQEIGDQLDQPQPLGLKTPIRFRLDRDRETYIADVKQCLDWINAGETYQVCLTNEIRTDTVIDSLALYRVLRSVNPAPFGAYFCWPGGAVLSASPERFLTVDNKGFVEAKPIKGTIRRDADSFVDAKLAEELSSSDKDRSENIMIVDLLRNDLSRVCKPGSVVVPKLCDVESYATVHQLVSTVRGELQPDMTIIDLLRASFPGGSMTGAPKIRTLELIDQLEQRARGVYSGAMGWFGFDGAADLSIVIRTIVQSGQELSFGVGGGVVAQSTPDGEFEEMLLKAKASIRAIVIAASGSFNENLFEIEGIE